jgi:surface antigen
VVLGVGRDVLLPGDGSLENQHLTRRFEEKGMKPRLANCVSAAFAACVLLLTPALAQVSLLTRGQGLSPEDNRLLFDSIARLNGIEPARAGNSDTWSNPQSNGSGTNTVLRVFRSGGMPCHRVQHHTVTGGAGRDYHLTWCRTSSGEWKIKA